MDSPATSSSAEVTFTAVQGNARPGVVMALVSGVMRGLHAHLIDDAFMAWLANVVSMAAGIASIAFIVWQWRRAVKNKGP